MNDEFVWRVVGRSRWDGSGGFNSIASPPPDSVGSSRNRTERQEAELNTGGGGRTPTYSWPVSVGRARWRWLQVFREDFVFLFLSHLQLHSARRVSTASGGGVGLETHAAHAAHSTHASHTASHTTGHLLLLFGYLRDDGLGGGEQRSHACSVQQRRPHHLWRRTRPGWVTGFYISFILYVHNTSLVPSVNIWE